MANGIFEQLAWLTKKYKQLCCIIENMVISSGVSRIIAGTGIDISPTGGTGEVTISLDGGGVRLPSYRDISLVFTDYTITEPGLYEITTASPNSIILPDPVPLEGERIIIANNDNSQMAYFFGFIPVGLGLTPYPGVRASTSVEFVSDGVYWFAVTDSVSITTDGVSILGDGSGTSPLQTYFPLYLDINLSSADYTIYNQGLYQVSIATDPAVPYYLNFPDPFYAQGDRLIIQNNDLSKYIYIQGASTCFAGRGLTDPANYVPPGEAYEYIATLVSGTWTWMCITPVAEPVYRNIQLDLATYPLNYVMTTYGIYQVTVTDGLAQFLLPDPTALDGERLIILNQSGTPILTNGYTIQGTATTEPYVNPYSIVELMSDATTWRTVSATPPAYTSYVATITQSGGTGSTAIDTGSLIVGVTYYINNDSPGMNFINVGAPTNALGTYFVATGTTPTSWGSLEGSSNATLTYDTGAPVVTVMQNELGNLWWEYDTTGTYSLNSTGSPFTIGKTAVSIGPSDSSISSGPFWTEYDTAGGTNVIQFKSYDPLTVTLTDGYFNGNLVEIKVYN